MCGSVSTWRHDTFFAYLSVIKLYHCCTYITGMMSEPVSRNILYTCYSTKIKFSHLTCMHRSRHIPVRACDGLSEGNAERDERGAAGKLQNGMLPLPGLRHHRLRCAAAALLAALLPPRRPPQLGQGRTTRGGRQLCVTSSMSQWLWWCWGNCPVRLWGSRVLMKQIWKNWERYSQMFLSEQLC